MTISPSSPSQLGVEIPFAEPHALSVSLPTWSDNVSWALGNEGTVDAMSTGYPRFFIHRKISKLVNICLGNLRATDKLALAFPTAHAAKECLAYLTRHASTVDPSGFAVRSVHVPLDHPSRLFSGRETLDLFLATFPSDFRKLGKSFWQHTGMGISSRYAEVCLANLTSPHVYYDNVEVLSKPTMPHSTINSEQTRVTGVLQRRIASLVYSGTVSAPPRGGHGVAETSTILRRNIVTESDVFLYPSGMSSVWHSHQLVMSLRPGLKFVCLGFPYTDTVKILEKWGPGCIFYGGHPDQNIEQLEAFLQTAKRTAVSPSTPPIAAVFCECPSNPLLQSPDLPRLRELADEYDFLIIIDDTVGTFVNVDVLQYVDIVTTSLSKLFSGNADVLGGSLVLNPKYRHYTELKLSLGSSYTNDYFLPDLIRMEKNSGDFEARVHAVDANARAVCHFLRCRSLSFASRSGFTNNPNGLAIKDVFYPEWVTRKNYDLSRRPGREDNFGHLFSLTFVSLEASGAFYNALGCAKGPSLGTNFTLSCPYTILAHYWEREWAAGYGIEEGIVRVSVGSEDLGVIMNWFEQAVKAAEDTLGCC